MKKITITREQLIKKYPLMKDKILEIFPVFIYLEIPDEQVEKEHNCGKDHPGQDVFHPKAPELPERAWIETELELWLLRLHNEPERWNVDKAFKALSPYLKAKE